MRDNIKKFTFNDLNLCFDDCIVSKNNLCIKDSSNISFSDSFIKPSYGFDELFSSLLGESLYSVFIQNYANLCKSFIYITCYDYYDDSILDYNCFYLLLDSDFNLYKLTILNANLTLTDLNIKFNKMPEIFRNNSKLYFYSQHDKFIYIDGYDTLISIADFSSISSFCNYQDNLFFTSKNDLYSVYYTERIDIENIGEDLSIYSYINVDSKYGNILKLICFKNNLYIIQQYAISRVWITSGEFYIYSNCYINSRILKDTICELNDYLIFYSSSGLYVFDGNEFKQLFIKVTKKLSQDFENFKAVTFNNKYYLLSSMLISGNYKQVVIEFDINEKTPVVSTINSLTNLFSLNSIDNYNLIFVLSNGNEYEMLKLNSMKYCENSKYLKLNRLIFDDGDFKNIMNIKIISSGDYYIKITSDISSKIIKVKNNLNISSLGIKGSYFDIELYSDSYFEVKSILFSIQSCED